MFVNMGFLGASVTFSILLLSYSQEALSDKWCDASDLEQCPLTESCVVESAKRNPSTEHLNGTCRCLRNYKRDDNGDCVRVTGVPPGFAPLEGHMTSASSVAAGILVPLTLIAVVGALIYFGRRYQWWEKIRKSPVRQYDTVLIGAQMEGDDPPIA